MPKILVFSSTRADFGLLKNLVILLKKSYLLDFVVSGTHTSRKFGETINEIKKSNIKISKVIKWKKIIDNNNQISENFSITNKNISKILNKKNFDLVILLGDRYETLAAAIAAHLNRVPIAHLHGGELTSGIVDDAFRHSITKLSHLHFVSHIEYKKRVNQLGEDNKRIFIVGGFGVESIKNTKFLEKKDIEKKLKIKLKKKNIIVNFHPETLSPKKAKNQINEILKGLKEFKNDMKIFFTMPGADIENSIIFKQIKKFIKSNKNAFMFKSLGQQRYLSLIRQMDLMIGNSSSGILEMPYFKKITFNLGTRQQGRVKSKSVIDVKIDSKSISKNIKDFYKGKFRKNLNLSRNLYGNGNSSKKVIKILKRTNFKNLLNKKFVDIKI